MLPGHHRPWFLLVALGGAVVVGIIVLAQVTTPEGGRSATVTHIVDGDTLDVERGGEEVRVRLLNIDTPELGGPDQAPECLAQEAAEYLRSLVPEGTEVRLEYDVELQDQYGRDLAAVFTGDVLINAEMARAGLALPVLFAPNDRFYREVAAAQEEAQTEARGFYNAASNCPPPPR